MTPNLLPWTPRSLADAYAVKPAIIYPVAGVFQLPSLNIVYGQPGGFKSFIMADCAACVATGAPWLLPLPSNTGAGIPTTQMPVLWLDCDNGERRSDDRFAAIGRAHKLPATAALSYVSMPRTPWPDFSKPSFADNLALTMLAWGVRFLVVDNLGLVSGDADEISAQMAPVMANFRCVAETVGAAVIVIHHQRKATGSAARKGDTLRGHSSIEASLDLALLVEREDGAAAIRLLATKTRGADVDPLAAVFTYTHFPGTKELSEARFFGLPAPNPDSDKAIEVAIFEVLQSQGALPKSLLQSETKKAGGWTKRRIEGVIDTLIGSGRIQTQPGPHNATICNC